MAWAAAAAAPAAPAARGGGGGTGGCTSTLAPLLSVNPPAGTRPLVTAFDTTGTTLDCGQTAQDYLLFPGNGAVVALSAAPLSQSIPYTFTIPGFYLAATYLSESPSGRARTSPSVAIGVTRGSDGTPPPTVALQIQNMGAPLAFAFSADVTLSMNPFDPMAAQLWDFGDGVTSGVDEPQHTYPQNGIYQVSYIVTTQRGMAAYARAILVISDSSGHVPASMLVGAMPAETAPMQPVQVSAFVENLGGASVKSARVIWPDNADDEPSIGTPNNGIVTITSSRGIAEPDEYDIPVNVTLSTGQELASVAHIVVANADGTPPSPVPLSKPYGKALVGAAYEINGPGAISRSLLVRGDGPFTFTAGDPSPTNVVVDAAGNFNWKPTKAQVGNQRIAVKILDADGKVKTMSWVVLVEEMKTGGGCGCDLTGTGPTVPGAATSALVALMLLWRSRRRRG